MGDKKEDQSLEEALASHQSENVKELVERAMADMGIEFKLEEAHSDPKITVTIYGKKGDAKTATALGFPGTISAISLDRKTSAVKEDMYENDSRIEVFDGIEYLNDDPDYYTTTSAITHEYICYILKELAKREQKPDWILIDGMEILSQIAEMKMRYKNKMTPFQGVKPLSLWKERKLYMREIHHKALDACNFGVIYTTYTDKDEIVKDGEYITKEDVPKWADLIMYETDIVIRSKTSQTKNSAHYKIKIISSKYNSLLPSGQIYDLTGKKTVAKMASNLQKKMEERTKRQPAPDATPQKPSKPKEPVKKETPKKEEKQAKEKPKEPQETPKEKPKKEEKKEGKKPKAEEDEFGF